MFSFVMKCVHAMRSSLGIRSREERDFDEGYGIADFAMSHFRKTIDEMQGSHDTLVAAQKTNPQLIADLMDSRKVTYAHAYFAGFQKRITEEKAKTQA